MHIHDVFIENGDDSVVVKPGYGGACTRDVLVERVRVFRGMGVNIGGMGEGCVQNVTFRDVHLEPISLAGAEIKTEHGSDNASFIHDVLYQNITFRASAYNASAYPCLSITAHYAERGQNFSGLTLPKISNVAFRDIDLGGCEMPVELLCDEAQPCENVSFSRVTAPGGFVCENVSCTASDVVPPTRCCA